MADPKQSSQSDDALFRQECEAAGLRYHLVKDRSRMLKDKLVEEVHAAAKIDSSGGLTGKESMAVLLTATLQFHHHVLIVEALMAGPEHREQALAALKTDFDENYDLALAVVGALETNVGDTLDNILAGAVQGAAS